MEERQLDFNVPLISVRRHSSPSNSPRLVTRKSLPPYKHDREIEKVTQPGAIPFHWEQFPGTPKWEVESQVHTQEEPPYTPRLPPARVSDAFRRHSGETSWLPWEISSGSSRYNSWERSNDQDIRGPQVEVSSSDHAILLEKIDENLTCKDESEAYSDARDTHSWAESWSLNCSASGVDGCHGSGVKPSGTFCVDNETREFIMSRFLPAAKAVALEMPEHVVKKPPALNEQTKQAEKVVSSESNPSPKQYSSVLQDYVSYMDNMESLNEDQERGVPVKKLGKAWGILPRFSMKNSLRLLNPLPGMKRRTSTPPTGKIRRITSKEQSRTLDKNAFQAFQALCKKKIHSRLLSREQLKTEDKVSNDSSQFLNNLDLVKPGASPLRRYRSASMSPFRNESPRSPFRRVGFHGIPEEVDDRKANDVASPRMLFNRLHDVSRNQIKGRGSSGPMGCDAVEKTLYIDSTNKTDLPILKSSCKNSDGLLDFFGEKFKVLADSRWTEEQSAVKWDQDASWPHISEDEERPSIKFGSTDKVLRSSSAPKVRNIAAALEDINLNQDLDQGFKTLECISEAKKIGGKEERKLKSDNRRECVSPTRSILRPPLPKSPTESWLWCTSPSHSRQISRVYSKKQAQ